jgi:hypothetical protein
MVGLTACLRVTQHWRPVLGGQDAIADGANLEGFVGAAFNFAAFAAKHPHEGFPQNICSVLMGRHASGMENALQQAGRAKWIKHA